MSISYDIIDDNLELFSLMLRDISMAKESVNIETYRFAHDAMGEKFLKTLVDKVEEGVRIRVLVDAWGTGTELSFFKPLIELGGEVRIFKKPNFERGHLIKNHCRNHRKLTIIDNRIAYLGSSNISAYSIPWRELNLRIENPGVIKMLIRSFRSSYRSYNKYSFSNLSHKKDIRFEDWTLIQDLPNAYRQRLKKEYENLIDKAKEEVCIETPYFLPGHVLRRKLGEAVARGVKVRVMMPNHSDVRLVDIIRRKYLGELHLMGVELCFYTQGNLHSKGIMIDNKIFSISSANFDYRSFRYQYELALIGTEKEVIEKLKPHFEATYQSCIGFNYEIWKSRSRIEKLFEWILLPIRYLL